MESIKNHCELTAEMLGTQQTISEDEPHFSSGGRARAVSVAIGLTIASLLCGLVLGIIVAIILTPSGVDFGSPLVVVLLVMASQLGFFVTGYLYIRWYRLAVPFTPPGRRDLAYALGGVIGALAFATVASYIYNWADILPDALLEEVVTQEPIIAIWLAILSILVVAPAEEFLFRGVIQGRLRNTFAAPGAIIGASLLFGSLHLFNFSGNVGPVIGWTLVIAGVGVLFGFLYERTQNLAVPIIVHSAYNCILFTVGYLMM